MGLISRTVLIVIIVILALTFLPKHNGTVICFGCEDRDCRCFGVSRDSPENGDLCMGVPYDCEEIPEPGEEQAVEE